MGLWVCSPGLILGFMQVGEVLIIADGCVVQNTSSIS
jgi:hypothetical protein